MKKFISVIAIMLMLALTACSNKETPPTTDNSGNTQSDSVTMLEEGVWPENEYTEGLPVPPGTVSWVILDTEREHCAVNILDISDTEYNEYMELLKQAGFSVIEEVSEEIKGQDYVSIGTILTNEEKGLSISYIPDNFSICGRIKGIVEEDKNIFQCIKVEILKLRSDFGFVEGDDI